MGISTLNVQGPYSAWTGRINSGRFSWLAAGVSLKDGSNTFYIVSGGLGGDEPGLFVLRRNYTPGGPFSLVSSAPVTPAGADARWPALYTDSEEEVTLFYTVNEGGLTVFYSMPISGGAPTLVYSTDEALDARPASVIDTGDDGLVLLVHEFSTGAVRAVYLNGGEAVTVSIPVREGRLSVYFDVRLGRLRYFYEDGGVITAGDFYLSSIPSPTGN
jgi:hypothetical protein